MRKKSSLNLIEKSFYSKEKGVYTRYNRTDEFIFLELYLSKKFSNIVHHLPFTELALVHILSKNSVRFELRNYKNNSIIWFGKDYMKEYKKTQKRFTLFLGAHNTKQFYYDLHGDRNDLIFLYDSKYNELQIFDSDFGDLEIYKEFIEYFFKELYGYDLTIMYINVKNDISEMCSHILYKSNIGFVSAWILWYIDYRLTNLNKKTLTIINNSLTEFNKGDKVCRVIIGYAMFIDKFLKHYEFVFDKNKGGEIIDTRTNKKYNIPKKVLYLGFTAILFYIIKKFKMKISL